MSYGRTLRAKHGRRYTREGDDPVNRLPDTDPGVYGAVSSVKLLDDGLPGPEYLIDEIIDTVTLTDSVTVVISA